VVSTFFLHAFLPFRDGCLCCAGAATEVAIVEGLGVLGENAGCVVEEFEIEILDFAPPLARFLGHVLAKISCERQE